MGGWGLGVEGLGIWGIRFRRGFRVCGLGGFWGQGFRLGVLGLGLTESHSTRYLQ